MPRMLYLLLFVAMRSKCTALCAYLDCRPTLVGDLDDASGDLG